MNARVLLPAQGVAESGAPALPGRHPTALEALPVALAGSLPCVAQVAVCWRDAVLGNGAVHTPGCPRSVVARAARMLRDGTGAGDALDLAWATDDNSRCAIAVSAAAVAEDLRGAWRDLARLAVDAALVQARAGARIESLENSERLQQALYEIADLAGSGLELQEMLRRIHAVVGHLMYAENCYIVLYDAERASLRFLYFADQRDLYVADPDRELSIKELGNSLTVALLRHGQPLLGPSTRIREALGVQRDATHGPDSKAWLGVPMRRQTPDGEQVCGAIVVQSYDSPASYTQDDRALLSYVAQHILTAIDRRHARAELEQRVEERTSELQQANLELQGEIAERERAEQLQRTLFRIAELSISSSTLEGFYAAVHLEVGELLYAHNLYIALLDESGAGLEFPYSIDERDAVRPPRPLGLGLTEYVLRTREPLLADRARIEQLEAAGEVRSHGTLAHYWLGVPLWRDEAVVGVIAVQSYSPEVTFDSRDRELLTFVAHHIGSGLARKQAQERLLVAHGELEQRVAGRTRELASANRALTAQVAERLRAEDRLRHQAMHDALTGLPNRPHLLERLQRAIAQVQARPGYTFAVLFLDLDRFKLVNDSVGHVAGDDLLVQVGGRLSAVLREGDIIARLGGDEFAILIEGVEDLAGVQELADRILVALSRPVWVAGRELFPSASIGIAIWHPRYQSGEDLLRDADAAMYRAKATGRERSAVFDEAMREEAMRLLDLEADLRRAIIRGDFEPYYQPIVRLSDHRIEGFEALLRWRHDQRGLLVPADFIGLGEDTGLIEQVDWLLYEQVIGCMARGVQGYVSINVSPRHFRSDDFAPRLLGLLKAADADPARLRIEITEFALLEDADSALRTLHALRAQGVLAQLDDFGTGFSALSYLHRFPIKSLKIDQSFVAGLDGETQSESLALIRAILALATTLNIETIGEGIETQAQCDALRQLGCQYGQGYLLGRPGELCVADRPDVADAAEASTLDDAGNSLP